LPFDTSNIDQIFEIVCSRKWRNRNRNAKKRRIMRNQNRNAKKRRKQNNKRYDKMSYNNIYKLYACINARTIQVLPTECISWLSKAHTHVKWDTLETHKRDLKKDKKQ
jgi:hypothetical protein